MSLSPNPDGKRLKRNSLPILLMLTLALIMSRSVPAQAKCCGDGEIAAAATTAVGGATNGLLGSIEGGLEQLNMLVYETQQEILKAIGTQAVSNTAAQSIQANMDQQRAEDLRNAIYQETRNNAIANIAAENTPPNNSHACNMIVIGQAPIAADLQEIMIAAAIVNWINKEGRGAGVQWDGPQFTKTVYKLRCAHKFANPLDGYPSECVSSDTWRHDLDLTPPGQDDVLQFPKMKCTGSGNSQSCSFDPQTEPELRFMAKIDYCFHLAGSYTTPSTKINTPEGMQGTVQFVGAASFRNTFIERCARTVARQTRLDCVNETKFKAICEPTINACNAAIQNKVALPPSIDCAKGLSRYQAEYVARASCASVQKYIAASQGGTKQPKLMEDMVACQHAWAAWKAQIAAEDNALVNALNGLIANKPNMIMGNGPKGYTMSEASEEKPAVKKSNARTGKADKKPAVAVLTPARAENEMPRGVPISADEITLPDALDQ